MRADAIRRVVVVGGGTAGWMAAAAIARIMGATPDLSVELVESDAIGTVGVGESTIPQIVLFNAMLGIDEAAFVRATGATYKLGIEFVDWTPGERFMHPFGRYGIDMQGVEFHHHWLKARMLDERTPLEAYSPCAAAARAGRFAHPRPDLPRSPLSRMSYAFQFDAGLYAAFLRRLAEGWGVRRTEGRIVSVERHGETGLVEAVVLESDARVEGDLFIDCSGFAALLIGEAMGAAFEDWSRWLPCDRALAVPCESAGERLPMTRATARAAGWQWRIPLQHRTGNGHVYCSAYQSDDEAAAVLLAGLDGAPLADPRPLRFTAGYRPRAWTGNVVALGLAGGFLEPLESTSIHLVQTGIARLMTLFPTRRFDTPEIDRFNAEMAGEYRAIRDLLVLHYHVNGRPERFWQDRRDQAPPDGLAAKLALYRANGRVVREDKEVFAETSWVSVMHGKGLVPAGYHPAADTLADGETLARLADIRSVTQDTVASMMGHEAWLREIGADLTPRARVPA